MSEQEKVLHSLLDDSFDALDEAMQNQTLSITPQKQTVIPRPGISEDVGGRREVLGDVLGRSFSIIERVTKGYKVAIQPLEVGKVVHVGEGVARVTGLPGVRSEELVRFDGGAMGLTFNLDAEEVGVILLGESSEVCAGSEVRRTRQVADVPVGYELLGRVIDPLGSALDGKGKINTWQRRPIERPAPSIMDRVPVDTPLQTGIKAIDALIPIGRGQRELILGDRQTGKTALIIDTIINQKDQNVVCVYCAIGQEKSKIAKVIAELRRFGALSYCVIVSASGDTGPGLKYIAPYAATSIAEHFMEQGRDVMIAYDDLTRHAQAYRELSLLLRRPPGREAYPGDIFYVHSRLLERATHLRAGLGGGSLTAIPVIETHGQNLSAYVPTNLISITDGQVYLSPELFRKGVLPAIDIGRSVSRVGGKAQLPAYRRVAGDLSLSYSQFEELESFSRFGTRLDEDTRRTIDRGRRVREVLKQQPHRPMPVAEQIAVLFSVINGLFDDVPVDRVREIERAIAGSFIQALPDLYVAVQNGEELDEEDYETMLEIFRRAMQSAMEA